MEIIVFRKKLALALLLLFLNTVLFPLTWYTPQKNIQISLLNTIETEAPGSLLELIVETCLDEEKDTPFCPQTPQEEETSVFNSSGLLEEFIHSERHFDLTPVVIIKQLPPDFQNRAYHTVALDVHIQPPEILAA